MNLEVLAEVQCSQGIEAPWRSAFEVRSVLVHPASRALLLMLTKPTPFMQTGTQEVSGAAFCSAYKLGPWVREREEVSGYAEVIDPHIPRTAMRG